MNLSFNTQLAENYHSKSQQARVMTEHWVLENGYCPNCGNNYLSEFANNRPVADFYCQSCREEFELKSKQAKFSNIINDGAYATMIERLKSDNNPNFFFLNYSKDMQVSNFVLIPKQFFTPDIIIKRKPLAPTARRAGWVGCKIDLSNVPSKGKVFLVKNGQVLDRRSVQADFKKTLFLRENSQASRGWTLEILKCLDRIPKQEFSLEEVYQFEHLLQQKYPNNHFIKDKIRQQLQVLRDKNLLDFLSRGRYRKL